MFHFNLIEDKLVWYGQWLKGNLGYVAQGFDIHWIIYCQYRTECSIAILVQIMWGGGATTFSFWLHYNIGIVRSNSQFEERGDIFDMNFMFLLACGELIHQTVNMVYC